MRRAWGLPPNDPRLQDLTDADYLRELALLEAEADDLLDPDANDPQARAAREEFEREIELAASGDFEALGLDAPGFEPQTVQSFLTE